MVLTGGSGEGGAGALQRGSVLGQAGCRLTWEYGQLTTGRVGWATPRGQSCLWERYPWGSGTT